MAKCGRQKNPNAGSAGEDEFVAMKIIKNPCDDAWIEVDLLKRTNHPHIAKYFTSRESIQGDLCIIIEYCDGGTFTELVEVCSIQQDYLL